MADAAPDARALRVARPARRRYGLDDAPSIVGGFLRAADLKAVRRLAARMSLGRVTGGQPVLAGEIAALVVLHEAGYLVIDHLQAALDPAPLSVADQRLRAALGADLEALLQQFSEEFPSGAGTASREPRPAVLAELLLTRVANENPAAAHLRELVDDRGLQGATRYEEALAVLDEALGSGPGMLLGGVGLDVGLDAGLLGGAGLHAGLLAVLRAPAAQAPTSLAGQLRYVRDRWGPVIGQLDSRLVLELDLALGELEEDERALHRRFGLGAPGTPGGSVDAPQLAGLDADVERFSPDHAWMPGVVLLAKSTHVWLDQLSRRHGREIRTLDGIPDEELDTLARWGVTGIWLIGLWERSKASERIKRLRGNQKAMASAYALDDYRIAVELGGEGALADLRRRATARGIRLASDMVPNHMGIDSRWVVEHPDWFLSVPEPPYPSYTFSGPDLSTDARVQIVLEDHYWDDSDAAVVFLRRDQNTGEERFIYHGNDGTGLPWNDTAQLDFLRADVREHVIQAILDVARCFPIIRFDAAMVLARRHVARLWWPAPGSAGGVPSRAAHALSPADFDRLMPAEFWRDAVDRVAAEVPGTLLLAEAFWLLEGYFVRTLGMHRVYNSAFMHMLRDEDNTGYRRVIRETLEFDPEILERYVNFMSNPDEATAVEQFGTGDKYFGVATVLATLPGLPMLGHGQVEGFGEKYGMEFRRAMRDEAPNRVLVARHEHEIFPLLRERSRYARAGAFRLYDVALDDGSVAEDVLAWSNGRGPERTLVVFHNRYASVVGRLRVSAPYAVKAPDGTKTIAHQALADALELPDDPGAMLAFDDRRTGLQHLSRVHEIRERGLRLSLAAYACHVFDGFRLLDGGTGRWGRLADTLAGGGVASLEDALLDLDLAPLHDELRALIAAGHVQRLAEAMAPAMAPVAPSPDAVAPFPDAAAIAPAAARDATTALDAVAAWDRGLRDAAARLGVPDRSSARDPRTARDLLAGSVEAARQVHRVAPLLAATATRTDVTLALLLGGGSFDPSAGDAARARFDACRLAGPLADGLRNLGLDGPAAAAGATRVRALLALPRPTGPGSPETVVSRIVAAWLADPAVRDAVGIHRWQDADWLVREPWEGLVNAAAALHALTAGDPVEIAATTKLAEALRAAAESAGYRLDHLAAS